MTLLETAINSGLIFERVLHPNSARNLVNGINKRIQLHGHKMSKEQLNGHMRALAKLAKHVHSHKIEEH